MSRQIDAPPLTHSGPLRRVAIDLLDEAYWRRPVPQGLDWFGAENTLDSFLNAPAQPSVTTDWVERILREALRG